MADLSVSVPNFADPLDFVRIYDNQDMDSGVFGRSWFHTFESRVILRRAAALFFPNTPVLAAGNGSGVGGGTLVPSLGSNGGAMLNGISPEFVAEVRTPDGKRLLYKRQGSGSFAGPVEETAVFALIGSTSAVEGYTLTLLDKTVYRYNAAGKLAGITDPNGNQVTLNYTGGTLTAVKDPANRTLYTFAYGSDGNLSAVTDLAGRTVGFSYQDGMLSRVESPAGITTYGYGSYGISGLGGLMPFASGAFASEADTLGTLKLITSVTSPNGHVMTFAYSPPSEVVDYSRIGLTGNTGSGDTTSKFTLWGELVRPIRSGNSGMTGDKYYYAPLLEDSGTFTLDKATFAMWYFPLRYLTVSESGPLGTFTLKHTIDELLDIGSTEVTDPRGGKSTYKWELVSGHGLGAQFTDAGGGFTATTYDVRNNPVVVVDRAGRTTQFVYDSKNNVTSVIDPLANRTNFTYEPTFNSLASVTDPKGNTSQFTYDGQGNLTRAQDAQSHAVQIGYNANGLPVSITDPLSHTVTITRDGNGYATQITDPLTRSARMGYDNIGRVVSFTDGANKQTQFAYDTDDNLTQVTDAINGVTHYNYTAGIIAEGKLLSSLEDAKSHTTQFGYDTRGRLTSVTNPLNQTRSYEYDEANNLTKVTKADGVQITFEYDNLNRLTKKNIPGDPVSYAYDAANNLISAEDNASKIQLGYDAGDRPTRVIQTNKAANLTSQLDYEYDTNGNRTKMTLAANPTAFVWSYTYDTLNRLTRITTPDNTNITFEYDALSRRTRMVYPNGTEANYTYDNASQLLGVTHKRTADNTIIAQANYQYDTAGNRTSMTDTLGTHSYGYDDLHRLTSATHPTASALDVKNEVFNYDGVGNRTSDAGRSNYTYDAGNRLNSDSLYDYTYDVNGNLTDMQEKVNGYHTVYAYNDKKQLVGVTVPDSGVVAFKYDVAGRRIEKSVSIDSLVNTLRYVYDGEDIIAIVDGNNSLVSWITYGDEVDDPLILKSSTTSYYYHTDGLGSVSVLTNHVGVPIETIEYSAYGKPVFKNGEGAIITNSAVGNLYSYTSREYDAEIGALYYRARYYSAENGRFLQEDTIGFAGGVNFYEYAWGNPVNNVDPNGLTSWPTEKKKVTSKFGYRSDPITGARKLHAGIDISQKGTSGKVYAADAGIVKKVGADSIGTNYIIVQESDSGYFAGYYHTKATVTVGTKVKECQMIGRSDRSGRSTGLHLHYSRQKLLNDNSTRKDPMSHLNHASLYEILRNFLRNIFD